MPEIVRETSLRRLAAGVVEYRLERRAGPAVVIFHGGHMQAGLTLGEEVFAEAGHTVLAPSRPGYGRTPCIAGGSVAQYTDLVRALCADLGISQVAAVVGVSAGGPTAATMAARHPDLVERLILVSSRGWGSYPDGRAMRLGAGLVFHPAMQRVTWAAVHMLARLAPDLLLRRMLASLSTRPVGEVMAALRAEDRALLLGLFGQMRSGEGIREDLRPVPDVSAQIDQPTLVIATRTDRGVAFTHAQASARAIRNAELVESSADSHFVWFGPDWPMIAGRIRSFLSI